ncbi:hypothetical protein LEP1GSC202_0039 [Leptospira yanagawae serovar Saopaulo str. Sao Paulo = ATCC 700523]|uniref:Uncharacterized protein n=1 Tax=Leptospira yanagawae serovar Saopaulo str. Sao Paulo = ATCC 700523 TaxID=1249483 RepID=A0A5E8H6T2_9LEPT|nr:hypothetical protein LEP1GSC202_0039 [Leptospira yanagawae serovar Saopaulo str. Sao Paulo = ATCC 700523]
MGWIRINLCSSAIQSSELVNPSVRERRVSEVRLGPIWKIQFER